MEKPKKRVLFWEEDKVFAGECEANITEEEHCTAMENGCNGIKWIREIKKEQIEGVIYIDCYIYYEQTII